MSQRFVIDINVNGGQQGTGGAAPLAAGLAAGSRVLRAQNLLKAEKALQRAEKALGRNPDPDIEILEERWDIKRGFFGGTATQTITGRVSPDSEAAVAGEPFTEINPFKTYGHVQMMGAKVGDWADAHAKQIKGLGVAAAWKAAGSALEVTNYTSGDSAANKQRAMGMKMATYGAAIMATGGNLLVIAGFVGNELISAGVDAYKYSYDRKMERGRIMNMANVAGDISYGRRRGGR